MRDDSLLIPAITILAGLIGLLIWPFVAIFFHEFGHAATGKLIGLTPTHFVVGHPDEDAPLFSFQLFGCKFECWPLPFGGATFFSRLPTDGLRMFIITVGGPVMDALVIFVSTLLWHYTFLRFGLFFIILSQSLDMLINLIPRSFRYAGVRIPNDGKILLQLLAGKGPDPISRCN